MKSGEEHEMPIYEITETGMNPLIETSFHSAGIRERQDLQRYLRERVEVIAPEMPTLVIAEEFGDWDRSLRRIDLLAIDKQANLVVIELKRTEDGGHMELQALRYAAMVSKMTFDQAVNAYDKYVKKLGSTCPDPRKAILAFLEWENSDDEEFPQDVRIILASAEFSPELTSSVLWLRDHEIDIRCVRLKPYSIDMRTLVDVQEIIPLPEEENYQIRIQEKRQQERQARTGKMANIRARAVEKLRDKPDGIRYADLVRQIADETKFTKGSIQSAIWNLDKTQSTVENKEGLFRIKPSEEKPPPVQD
jgi:hypothetical protein